MKVAASDPSAPPASFGDKLPSSGLKYRKQSLYQRNRRGGNSHLSSFPMFHRYGNLQLSPERQLELTFQKSSSKASSMPGALERHVFQRWSRCPLPYAK